MMFKTDKFIAFFPKSFSRLRIFLSYSGEYRVLAEEIAQSLRNAGDTVFFDKDTLPLGQDYNDRILKAIGRAHRFIFLASRSALASGKYTLTELHFVKERWPSPQGKVFPILVDPELKPEELPPYLRLVHALHIGGNATAEISAAINRSRTFNALGKACLSTAALSVACAIGYTILFQQNSSRPDIALLTDQQVHFRPRMGPPPDPQEPATNTDWIDSPLTITIMITYRNSSGSRLVAQVLGEEVLLEFGSVSATYRWAFFVAFKDEGPCGTDWLCVKEPAKSENLDSGRPPISRETMFLPVAVSPLTWRQFIDEVLAVDGPKVARVTLRSRLATGSSDKKPELWLQNPCSINVEQYRAEFLKIFSAGANPRPTFWLPTCE